MRLQGNAQPYGLQAVQCRHPYHPQPHCSREMEQDQTCRDDWGDREVNWTSSRRLRWVRERSRKVDAGSVSGVRCIVAASGATVRWFFSSAASIMRRIVISARIIIIINLGIYCHQCEQPPNKRLECIINSTYCAALRLQFPTNMQSAALTLVLSEVRVRILRF